MIKEMMGDYRCVLRAYHIYQNAKQNVVKQQRLENVLELAHNFENKWNNITHQNLKFSEWIYYIERSNENEIYKRVSR